MLEDKGLKTNEHKPERWRIPNIPFSKYTAYNESVFFYYFRVSIMLLDYCLIAHRMGA